MTTELPAKYDPSTMEPAVMRRWLDGKAFAATPDQRDDRYVVMMPLPNVTGALHMGHAMDNVMQDLLIRWHRMQGDNSLWQAGLDHAGIATQAVVEKRLKELENKTRHDVGREGLVDPISFIIRVDDGDEFTISVDRAPGAGLGRAVRNPAAVAVPSRRAPG